MTSLKFFLHGSAHIIWRTEQESRNVSCSANSWGHVQVRKSTIKSVNLQDDHFFKACSRFTFLYQPRFVTTLHTIKNKCSLLTSKVPWRIIVQKVLYSVLLGTVYWKVLGSSIGWVMLTMITYHRTSSHPLIINGRCTIFENLHSIEYHWFMTDFSPLRRH